MVDIAVWPTQDGQVDGQGLLRLMVVRAERGAKPIDDTHHPSSSPLHLDLVVAVKAGSVIPLSHRLLSRHPWADYALRMVGCALLHRPQKPTSSPPLTLTLVSTLQQRW